MSFIPTTIWNRVISFFAIGGGVLLGRQNGLMGANLAKARATNDFFRFFNFEPIGTEKPNEAACLTTFKPSGEAFKALVTLCVRTNGKGAIREMQLFIARSFIDDSRHCVYAADLAKSFLRQASPTSASDGIGSLSTEIEAWGMARSTVTILSSRASPSLPRSPPAAYQTYAGDPHPQTLAYSNGKSLLLRNMIRTNEPVLEMKVSAAP
jgi:hypothetical protein